MAPETGTQKKAQRSGLIAWPLLFGVLAFFAFSLNTHAQGANQSSWENFSLFDLVNIAGGLACWLSRIGVPVIFIFLTLAGYHFVVARDNPEAFNLARRNFLYVLVGSFIIFGVYILIATLAKAVGITNFSFLPMVC